MEAAGLAGLLAEAFAEAAAEVVGHPVERVMNLGINIKEIFSTKILESFCKAQFLQEFICGTGLHTSIQLKWQCISIHPVKRMVAGTRMYYKLSFHTM